MPVKWMVRWTSMEVLSEVSGRVWAAVFLQIAGATRFARAF
jgi:hypothetical protein